MLIRMKKSPKLKEITSSPACGLLQCIGDGYLLMNDELWLLGRFETTRSSRGWAWPGFIQKVGLNFQLKGLP